ncbi:DUF4275 family protein [Paenibacillus sp. V4I7]|uniref:DUF4275 family protein n=1 Tax=Paenibacillus sp. V4I7 TaxID=3042307 RepID=UPI0027882E66|nr:DUF4275 family protein [Paenibacillus sp. V4I7]MDQ0897465.1 hypothetical protein [Paenibacillus sp. V4I7]
MNLLDSLKEKKVKVQQIPNLGPHLRKHWENNFANHLSENEKKSIYLYDNEGYCGYLWHLFSYKKRESFQRQDANKTFDNIEKHTCYVFYQHSDDALLIEELSELTADEFINAADVYVVDIKFNWTYVITHETGMCGPYFSYRNESILSST